MVKITKEDFYKLKQLDRIEYRQRKEAIDKRHNGSVVISLINYILFFIAFMLLAIPLYKVAFGNEIFLNMLIIFKGGARLFQLALVLGIILDILSLIFYRKQKKELNADYFKEELIIKHGKSRNSIKRKN